MKNGRVKITTIFLGSFFVFIAISAIPFHWDDSSFRLAGCSICKVKSPSSFSVQKIGTKSLFTSAISQLWINDGLHALAERVTKDGPSFTLTLFYHSHSNKDPPLRS